MPATLIDTLHEIDYPITILSNYPVSGSDQGSDELKELIAKADSKAAVSLQIDFENEEPWRDEILEIVPEHNGLVVLNIQFNNGAWDFTIATRYDPEEVTKLRIKNNIGAMLHARCHMVSDITEPLPLLESKTSNTEDTSSLTPDSAVLEEISFLDKSHCLIKSENTAVYLFKGKEAPALLNLIGIGRAITFAAIGAGSGLKIDLSPEDEYYDHIMLWDNSAQCLVGAYRIGFTDEIIDELGAEGLYLNHIFNFKSEFYKQLGNAMELSRSFILPSYQKNPQMLDALWKGIGKAAMTKNCYTMYGSVTISTSFSPLSQAVLVDTLDRHHSDSSKLRACVSSIHPFTAQTKNHRLISNAWSELGINKLNNVIEDIEQNQRSIPPLIRYYVSLGAKFLAFQVEESFNNAIYCLLRVNLQALPKRYKRRFLGE